MIDGRRLRRLAFSTKLRCEACGIEYPEPEPQLFNFNRPLGACPECEGFGNIVATDMDRVVPDPSKSIREGAIAPWNTPAYAHELEELLALADDYKLPVDVPFAELTDGGAADRRRRRAGARIRRAEGLLSLAGAAEVQDAPAGVFEPLAIVLSVPGLRRRAVAAGGAGGARGRQEFCRRDADEDSRRRSRSSTTLELPEWQQTIARPLVEDVRPRLRYLDRRRRRLSRARATAAHAQRRRGAAGRAHGDARFEPGRHALRAR